MFHPKALGSLWMLVAGALFAVMGVCVKLGAARFSTAELVFYRSAFGLLTLLVIAWFNKLPLMTPHWRMHLSRSLTGFVSLVLFFYAITVLPLATAITLNYTAPLFLAIFTAVVLHERVHPRLAGAILLGFLGVVGLLDPTLSYEQWRAGILGLLSGITAGLAYLQVTQLGRMGEPEWRTVFYFTLVCTLGGALGMILFRFHPLHVTDLPLLVGMGASATLAQLAMTRAYRVGEPLIAGSLAYSTLVFASLFGVWFWNEILSAEQWLAIVLVVASGILSLRVTNRH
ncbi:MAG: DMT family transporter [Methylophilaceae bacterium]|nr:DMT family transporter [Methylophilaceae bacterium]